MCIIFLFNGALDEDNDYSLIIATNRDEFYKRPSKNMWYWEDDPNIIGGRDLESGCGEGTWLAISPTRKKLGVLLNLPRTPKPEAKSRGEIVTGFVKSVASTKEYIDSLKPYAKECNYFTFIAVEFGNLVPAIATYNNLTDELALHSEQILGFSNSLPDTPLKKVIAGKELMNYLCRTYSKVDKKEQLIEELIKLLKSNESYLPDPELEKRRPATQKQLSSIFVSIPEGDYGTRTHTLILMTKKGCVDIIEISLQPPIDLENLHWKKTQLQLDLQPAVI